jgi:hypothetical protein
MTIRFWWMLALSAGLAACTGGVPGTTEDKTGDDDDDDDVVGDDDDDATDTPTGETGDTNGTGYFEPYYFTVQATWGFNTTTGIVNAVSPYGETPSGVYVLLGTEDWAGDQFSTASDEYCSVLLPFYETGAPQPPFVAANGLWYGIQYDPTAGAATSCTGDFALDPLNWGYEPGYVIADPNYYTWGVGVTTLLAEYEENFDAEFLPFIAGGYMENNFFGPPEGVTGFYAHATEIDDNNNLQIDANNYRILINAEEIPVLGLPAPLAQAEYNVYSFFIFY